MEFFQCVKKVRARFNFPGTGEDELPFSKGDIISVTQVVDGGWWEGMIGESFGWFPSNYVKDTSGPGSPSKSAKKGEDKLDAKNEYQDEVLKDVLETDKDYCTEMKNLINNYLKPLHTADVLPAADVATLLCNLEALITFQESFHESLEDIAALSGRQRRPGACFLKVSAQYKEIYSTYCSNHPKTATILTTYLDQLSSYMESKGSSIMVLTTGLFRPFRRTERYPNDLMELERHTLVEHPDKINVTTAISVFKDIYKNCQLVRKQKEIELDIMTRTVQGWEGEPIAKLGELVKMIQASHQEAGSRKELVILLFPSHLVLLQPTASMSGYIYQHKVPIAKVRIVALPDTETQLGAFELSGPGLEKMTVLCGSLMDREDTVENVQRCQDAVNGVKSPRTKKYVPPPIPISQSNKWDTLGALSPRLMPDSKNKSATLPSPRTSSISPGPLSAKSTTPPPSPAAPPLIVGFSPAPPISPSTVWSIKAGENKGAPGKKNKSTKRKDKSRPEVAAYMRPERLEEDNMILRVIEAYCFSNGKPSTVISTAPSTDTAPRVILAEDEKIIVEATDGNRTVMEERSLIDTVYALRDQVNGLMDETKTLKGDLDKERKARRKLESSVRKSMKSMDFKATSIPEL